MLLLFAVAAPWSIAAAQAAVVLGALFVLAGILLARRRLAGTPPRPPVTVWLMLLFLGIQVLSIPLGIHPAHSLRSLAGSWVLLFPFLFWLLLAEARYRKWALRVLAASGGLAGLYGLIQHFLGRNWVKGHELEALIGGGGYIAVGSLGHHLSYAGVLLPLFFLALGLALDRRRSWLWWAAAACMLGGLGFSYARTAWVGLAAGLLVLGLCRGRRALAVIAVSLVVLAGLAMIVEPAIGRRLLSLMTIGEIPRTRLWLTSLHIVGDHPWIGGGLGSFKALFAQYRVPGEYMSTAHPHSDLLNVLVETGIPGGVAWVAIWVAFFWETRPRFAHPGGHPGRPWLPDALRAGVAALLVAGLGQCFSTDEKVAQVWYFVAAGALHLCRGVRRGEQPTGGAGHGPIGMVGKPSMEAAGNREQPGG